MSKHYNQSYNSEEIKVILDRIKDLIDINKYNISQNDKRKENQDFIDEYNITVKKQKEILLNIKVEDFCHTLQNTKKGYEYEILYVFVPQIQLFNAHGEEDTVDVYIKFNLIENSCNEFVVVISFHRINRPVSYLFK